jgi:hypothetical protein
VVALPVVGPFRPPLLTTTTNKAQFQKEYKRPRQTAESRSFRQVLWGPFARRRPKYLVPGHRTDYSISLRHEEGIQSNRPGIQAVAR